MIDLKYLLEKEITKNKNDENNIGINIINKTNINVNININNYHKENEIKKILSDIPSKIKDLKDYKEKKSITNLINNDKEPEKNTNSKRGIKPDDKPIMIIDNKNNTNKNNIKNKNDSFQIIDYIELNNNKEQELKLKDTYDTFCLGVLVSGLNSPIQLSSLIEKTDNFLAPCGHVECSMFPSIEPDILNSCINKNAKNFQELSQSISNMCFPLGIKPCFACKFTEKGIENSPDPQKTQQTFFNLIKNEKNECYYLATLQYFIKMTNQEYIMKYRFNPVTYVLDKMKNINNKDKKFKNSMQSISSLLNNSYVLIPESVSLISKYPFFISMEKCLRCLISLQKKDDMDNLINHLINEVPSPEKGFQIQFFIPRIEKPIILNHQYNKFLLNINNDNNNNKNKIYNNLLSSSQINMKILLEKINIENIIMIFQLLILEQKILFLENDYQTLSEIVSVFLELIYPLIWTNPIIPVLSTKTVRFLESPVPFIMGVDEYLLKYAIELKYINPGTEIIIFNIMENKFFSSKSKKRIHKKEIFKEFQLPIMSSKVREYIEKELKDIKKQIKSSREIDKQIRLVFLKSMIMLIGDYNNFIFYTEDEIPLFNKVAFVESHKDKTSQFFLNEMVKTQIFNQFLLNEKQLHTKFNFKLKKISNNINKNTNEAQQNEINYELIDTSYFKKLIALNQNLLNSEKIRSRAFSSKKMKKAKNKKSSEENDISGNNYIFSKNDKIKENIIMGNNNGDVNHSIDFSKRKNKIDLNQNVDISEAFSEKNDENYLKGTNNNKKMEKLILRAKSAKRMINLNKKEKEKEQEENEEEKIINSDEIKIGLLYPYFLNKSKIFNNIDEVTLNNIKSDIEEYSQKNNLKFLIQNSDHVFIRHSYKLNNILQKRFYLYKNSLKDNHQKRNSIDNNNDIDKNKNEINNDNKIEENKKGNENEINDNQKDFKLIKDTFIMCYTNKNRISKSQFNVFERIFLDENNKRYFAKLILPDSKMKKKKNHKLLTSSSFEDLSKLLYISLAHLSSNEYNTCRLLTISSFVYYKIENKKLIYLYENYIRGIKPCCLWQFDEFWSNFFKLEFDEELKNKNNSLNLYKYDFNGSINNNIIDNEQNVIEKEKEQVLFETIFFIAEIMIKLKLSKKFIFSIFEKKIFVMYGLDQEKTNFLIEQILDIYNKA